VHVVVVSGRWVLAGLPPQPAPLVVDIVLGIQVDIEAELDIEAEVGIEVELGIALAVEAERWVGGSPSPLLVAVAVAVAFYILVP